MLLVDILLLVVLLVVIGGLMLCGKYKGEPPRRCAPDCKECKRWGDTLDP